MTQQQPTWPPSAHRTHVEQPEAAHAAGGIDEPESTAPRIPRRRRGWEGPVLFVGILLSAAAFIASVLLMLESAAIGLREIARLVLALWGAR